MGGGRDRQREALSPRRIQDDAEILDEDPTAECGVKSRARMCGTRLLNIQELPALLEITSKSVCGSAPQAAPSAMASPAAARCTPARCWLIIFTVEPMPGSEPSR